MSSEAFALGCVARLAQSKNANVSPEVLQVYAELLAEYPQEAVANACRDLTQDESYGFPQCGAIITRIKKALYGDVKGNALKAWAEVLKAARRAGAYRGVEFADPAMAEALRIAVGSWSGLCSLDTESFQYSTARKTFLEIYEREAVKPRGGEPVYLPGLGSSASPYLVPRIDGLDTQALPKPSESRQSDELPPPDRAEAKRNLARLQDALSRRKVGA